MKIHEFDSKQMLVFVLTSLLFMFFNVFPIAANAYSVSPVVSTISRGFGYPFTYYSTEGCWLGPSFQPACLLLDGFAFALPTIALQILRAKPAFALCIAQKLSRQNLSRKWRDFNDWF